MAVGGRSGYANAPSSFSRSIDKIFDEAQVTSELKLCGRKLKEFPKGALKYNLSDTVFADLSKNRFGEVPVEVCDYESLEKLHLHQNAIKSIPDQITTLQCLSHLILSRNQLSVLPSCICQLSNLQVLDVSGNRLVSLPENLGLLTHLTDLDASYNQLQVLPPSLGDMDDLRWLRLRRNHLQNIPSELCFLRLTWLDLSYNRIAELPPELRFMSSLLKLLLEANPLVQPPANVCMRGRVHIFKWLEQASLKEDKRRGVLSEVEFRKSRKYTKCPPPSVDFRFANGGIVEGRQKRGALDSGYCTSSESGDRWSSNGSQECDLSRIPSLTKNNTKNILPHSSLITPGSAFPGYPFNGSASAPHTPGQSRSDNLSMSISSVSSENTLSGHSTPSTLSPGEPFNLEDEFYKAMKLRQETAAREADRNGGEEVQTRRPVKDVPRRPPLVPPPPVPSTGPPDEVETNGHHAHFSDVLDSSQLSFPNPSNNSGDTNGVQGKKHNPVPTYREYLEAKRQQRALETTSVYKRQSSDGGSTPVSPTSMPDVLKGLDAPSGLPRPSSLLPTNGTSHIPTQTKRNSNLTNGSTPQPRPTDLKGVEPPRELTRAQVKNIQKKAVLSYVKSRVSPSSPSKVNSSPTSPNTSFDSVDSFASHTSSGSSLPARASPYSNQSQNNSGYAHNGPQTSTPYTGANGGIKKTRSPPGTSPVHSAVQKTRRRVGGGHPFDPGSTPSRLNFTYRREIEKQQHEKQLLDNLRNIIETRLKVALPSDLSSALMDGVVLCHLVNHVRPRAVGSIHVPSPAVPKLTIAKCRVNVENFLEACRKIGVEEEYVCSASDVLDERSSSVRVAVTVERLLQFQTSRGQHSGKPSALPPQTTSAV